MKKFLKAFGMSIMSLIVILSLITPVNAEYVDKSEIYEEIRNGLAKYDVDEETQNHLIWKLENGEMWDSMSGEYIDLQPQERYFSENHLFEKTTYPDGSIKISDIYGGEYKEFDPIGTCGIGGGDFEWGSAGRWWKYTGATASESIILVKASFKIDYSGHERLQAQIDRIYDYSIMIIGGTYSYEHFKIIRKTASGNNAAEAELKFSLIGIEGLYSKTCYLKAHILNRSSQWTSYSF